MSQDYVQLKSSLKRNREGIPLRPPLEPTPRTPPGASSAHPRGWGPLSAPGGVALLVQNMKDELEDS